MNELRGGGILELLHASIRYAVGRRSLRHGRQIHACFVKHGLVQSCSLWNALLDLYCKCGLLGDAQELFEGMSHRDHVTWSTMLAAHAQSDHPRRALSLLPAMLLADGVEPDGFIFSALVKACARMAALRRGRQLHGRFAASLFAGDDVVKSALVDMYSKCGAVEDARKVFETIGMRNPACWTAMVGGYAADGRHEDAVGLFRRIPRRSLLSWTALISGFVQSGADAGAVELFVEMRKEGVAVDDSFALAAGRRRRQHGGAGRSAYVGNALVDMYAKCSSIASARSAFESLSVRDVFSWTTMIVGEAQHGGAAAALVLFESMVTAGVEPNEVTFVGVIHACSHGGLVEQGRRFFRSMVEDHGIRPSLQHYTCLLDLLSRAGLLAEAESIITTMPLAPDEATWCSLSIRVADHLLGLKPEDSSTYVLLSNTYAAAGRWDSVAGVRKTMARMEARKERGCSRVELGGESCAFTAGGLEHHPQREAILGLLEALVVEMKRRGYVPDTNTLPRNLQDPE
ncbi:unnamed protein product [Spirodela intermedia]|uniref:Uncharacterized protein n=1 Tax=Spirodela intermedia TaxID=51605 RepID=A0A7I8IQ12_SPIIN|nr:unnamed protein product [Spirodela intermedia]CAA6659872.1 unnamed protein product [Spirodela intermedia]